MYIYIYIYTYGLVRVRRPPVLVAENDTKVGFGFLYFFLFLKGSGSTFLNTLAREATSFDQVGSNRWQAGPSFEGKKGARQTEGDRLFRDAVCYLKLSAPEKRQAMRATDEIGRRRLLSQSISLKLRIRAVVWKRGAHQPGGPPLRTTTAPPFRSSPPGMDTEAGCVGPCETLGLKPPCFQRCGGDRLTAVSRFNTGLRRRQALHSIRMPQNNTLTAHSTEYPRAGEEHERCECGAIVIFVFYHSLTFERNCPRS